MSASHGRLQRLVYPPGSKVIQPSSISQFNNRGRGRGGCGRGRGYRGIGYDCVIGHEHGGQRGLGVRRYGQSPYEFASRYGKFAAEACVYPADQWRLRSLPKKIVFKK